MHRPRLLPTTSSQTKSVRTASSSLPEKTTLRQLLVLYTRSEILVTNDSGPAHFASLTAIHVVTLFGPETPATICRAIAKRNRVVGGHRVQSVRECVQQPAIGLPQQSLHASNHS